MGVRLAVYVSITTVINAQTAEPIEMQFGLVIWVGPGNYTY